MTPQAIIYGFTGVGSFGGMAAISALNGIAYGCYVTIVSWLATPSSHSGPRQTLVDEPDTCPVANAFPRIL